MWGEVCLCGSRNLQRLNAECSLVYESGRLCTTNTPGACTHAGGGGEVGGRERMRGEREKGKEGGSHTNTPGHVKGPNKPCSLIINIFFLVFYVYNLDA